MKATSSRSRASRRQRRSYIWYGEICLIAKLSEFEPSAELTGGAWYTDDKLDVEFIDQLSSQLLKYIVAKSSPSSSQHANAIFANTFKAFPTTRELHGWISKSGITSVTLSRQDVQALVDRLLFDGAIQRIQVNDEEDSDDPDYEAEGRVDAYVYKAIANPRDSGNALTDIPCGVCPVFSFCAPGGPVSPEGCSYFTQWLRW